jgi:hypothetical protein
MGLDRRAAVAWLQFLGKAAAYATARAVARVSRVVPRPPRDALP